MEDISLRFHYENLFRAVEQQAKFWELYCKSRNNLAGIGNFPRELPFKVVLWGSGNLGRELAKSSSSVRDNRDLTYLVNEATSQAKGDKKHIS